MTENIEQLDRRMCQLKDNIPEDDILVIVGGDGSEPIRSAHQSMASKLHRVYQLDQVMISPALIIFQSTQFKQLSIYLMYKPRKRFRLFMRLKAKQITL